MTKAVSLLIARETQTWIESLYDCGIVTIDEKGTMSINPNVRELVSQMHYVLSAGDPNKKEALEKAFVDAISATSALSVNMGPGTLSI